MQKIITSNSEETKRIKWDGIRYGIIEEKGDYFGAFATCKVSLFSPKEMDDIVEFVKEVKKND